MTPAQQFGANVARARERCGLSQSQLARKVEVVDTYISRIETGRAQPSFRLLLAIASQLNTTPAGLLDGIG
ncbi:MAG TPA: helix-turn-helix transcriptional regulator [Galbitalea sp.]|jgi:transcriptional regulator with XRE-family HTH domain|nr:helix-turn-helix transcriptional regulator [Galbitalea sp.]